MSDAKVTQWESRRRADRINALSAIRGLASDLLTYEQSNVKVTFSPNDLAVLQHAVEVMREMYREVFNEHLNTLESEVK